MLKNSILSIMALALTVSCKTTGSGTSSAASQPVSNCEIVIVGGGVAGLHTAYRLGPQYGEKICLFEKEARYGGRIYDIAKSPDQVAGPFIAVGGRRVMEGQSIVIALAKELGIELQEPPPQDELTQARGMSAINKDEMIKAFPGLPVNLQAGAYEGQLYDKLLKGPERAHVEKYKNLHDYVIAAVGQPGFDFLHETYRFRADFEYDLSAKAYLEYLDEENNAGAICPSGNCRILYPAGGMSAFARGLESKARGMGVRFFTSEPVLSIDKVASGYQIKTGKSLLITPKVVIAVPPVALANIGGNIPAAIRSQPQFKALIGVRVTTIAQWYDQPWWHGIKAKDGKVVWRAWTTGNCINSVEIPQEPYAAAQNVIRVVYNDQLDCVLKWETLANTPAAMEEEINKGLTMLFANNGVTQPVTITKPSKTVYWEWPDAWYFIRAGNNYSNLDIYKWAVQPLPGEDIALVSEGYNPQRSAWTDGAYKSSIHYLNTSFGMNLPGVEP